MSPRIRAAIAPAIRSSSRVPKGLIVLRSTQEIGPGLRISKKRNRINPARLYRQRGREPGEGQHLADNFVYDNRFIIMAAPCLLGCTDAACCCHGNYSQDQDADQSSPATEQSPVTGHFCQPGTKPVEAPGKGDPGQRSEGAGGMSDQSKPEGHREPVSQPEGRFAPCCWLCRPGRAVCCRFGMLFIFHIS